VPNTRQASRLLRDCTAAANVTAVSARLAHFARTSADFCRRASRGCFVRSPSPRISRRSSIIFTTDGYLRSLPASYLISCCPAFYLIRLSGLVGITALHPLSFIRCSDFSCARFGAASPDRDVAGCPQPWTGELLGVGGARYRASWESPSILATRPRACLCPTVTNARRKHPSFAILQLDASSREYRARISCTANACLVNEFYSHYAVNIVNIEPRVSFVPQIQIRAASTFLPPTVVPASVIQNIPRYAFLILFNLA